MGGGGHLHVGTARIPVGRWPRRVVVGLIVVSGLLAVLGVLHWWPDGGRVHQAEGSVAVVAGGITVVHAELGPVRSICVEAGGAASGASASCGVTAARVLDGAHAGRTVAVGLQPNVVRTGLRQGDRVLLLDLTGAAGAGGGGFEFYRADRGSSMLWLAVLFVIVVVLVAWRRGIMALLSLGFAGLVVVGYLIPALLSGRPPVPVTLAASVLILIVMLFATHGVSLRTSVALVGAILGLGLSAGFAWFGVVGARLAGRGDDSAELLASTVHRVDVQQLVVASVILAGLGTLNDVTVTQTSALWELRDASPTMPRTELFRRAMRIGRDHVASTVYTLVFAYLGTALVLIVAVQLYRGTPADFLTAEDVAEEVVRTLVGGVALVLAMPITTGIAALVAARGSGTGSPAAPAGPLSRFARRAPGPVR